MINTDRGYSKNINLSSNDIFGSILENYLIDSLKFSFFQARNITYSVNKTLNKAEKNSDLSSSVEMTVRVKGLIDKITSLWLFRPATNKARK